MVAFLYRAPAGVPGTVTRLNDSNIEAQVIDTATPPTVYGNPVKVVSGKLQPIAASDAATVVYGFLVRANPTNSSADPLGTSTPPTSGVISVMRRGYMTVKLAQGTGALDGQVYVRTTAASGKVVGQLEDAADSGNCVAIVGAAFMGPADANGNVEISYTPY